MVSDLLFALMRANLTGAAVLLVLLVARAPLRRLFGPQSVYALWLSVPAAALASLLPARTVTIFLHPASTSANIPPVGVLDWSHVTVAAWLVGITISVVSVARRERRFRQLIGPLQAEGDTLRASHSTVGPAVIGLIRPLILVPADFEERFSARERELILAHERVHLARGDSRVNGLALAVQCVNWFNPLTYVGARALRLDQELACDAEVITRYPMARRSYAEAMLKSQAAAVAFAAGCYWRAEGRSALVQRLNMLGEAPLPATRVMAGMATAALMTGASGATAWSAQPARQHFVVEPGREVPAAAVVNLASVSPPPRKNLRVAHVRPVARPAEDLEQLDPWVQQAPAPSWSSEWGMPMPPDPGDDTASAGYAAMADPSSDSGVQTKTVRNYRNGEYHMKSNFTPVGDKVEVSAELYKDIFRIGAGTTTTLPGETAYVALSNGQVARVAPGKTAYIITPQRSPNHANRAVRAPPDQND